MALVKCKDCGKEMSTSAKACPGCGAPASKGTSRLTIMVGGLFAIGVAMAVVNGQSGSSGSASELPNAPAEPKKEAQFQAIVAGAQLIKAHQKNPASFELETAMLVGEAMCYEFRGTNSFNARVPGHWVIVPSKKISSGDAGPWNANCARKTGIDYTFAKHAL